MKFSSILKKINFKSRKSMLKTGAILFWTDMKRVFNWNMDNFKSNFLSRGQLGSESNDKFFLSVLKMWQCCKYFFGNLIFALTARMLSGNRLNTSKLAAQLNASQTTHGCSIYSVWLHSLLLTWQFLALLLIADLIWLCTFLFPFSKETCVFVYKKYLILRAAVLSLKLHRS